MMDKGLKRVLWWHFLVVFGTFWQIPVPLMTLKWLLLVDFGGAVSVGLSCDESEERLSQTGV